MRRIVTALALIGMFAFAAAPSEASAAHYRSVSRGYGGGGIVSRTLGTRLYYSNAFRGMIPGTGYGGFRRPAFGNRGY